MSITGVFLRASFRGFVNRVAALSFFGEIKTAFFLFLGAIFAGGLYFFFWRMLVYLDTVPIVGPPLAAKFVSLVCLSVWWMAVFSSLNAAYANFYFSSDTQALLSWPISASRVTAVKLFRTFRDSSSAALAAMVPLAAAFGAARGAPPGFYFWSAAALVPFFFTAAASGTLAVLVVSAFFPASRARRLVWVLLAGSATGVYVLLRLLEPERLARPDALEAVAEYLSFLEAPAAAGLPSGLYYSVLARAAAGRLATPPLAQLIFYALAAFVLASVASKLFYRESLAAKNDFTVLRGFDFARARSAFGRIVALDAGIFFREPQRWSQIMLVAGLFAVYLASMAKIPADTFYLKTIVAFANVGLVGFMASALALRFVFAAFSEESPSWWLWASSPLTTENIIRAKFFPRAAAVAVMSSALYAASAALLRAPYFAAAAGWLSATGLAAALASGALYFGVRFPRKNFVSTAEIEGSSGGLFYVAAALFYIALNLAAVAWPFRTYYLWMLSASSSAFPRAAFAVTAIIVAVNSALALICYRRTVAAAERYE